MSDDADQIQDLMSRNGALHIALEATLARLAKLNGTIARREIEALRDDLVRRFKNSGIIPERELDHAKVAGPAIEVIETVFNSSLEKL